MKNDGYQQIMEVLLSIKEDMGEMKSDIKSTKALGVETATTVRKHDGIIENWSGRLAIIGVIAGVVGTTIVTWIKTKILGS